jgi:TetR/AcrR family transcriptional regulator, transcriptional repressor of bet genes
VALDKPQGKQMTDVTENNPNTKAKRPRTASKQVRRRQLIDATIESISKYGISGTTMTTVTSIAGLSMGLVNFHFKTKEILFEETLKFLAEEHRDQWKKSYGKAELTPEAKLLSIVDAHYHPNICSRKKLAVWFGFYGEAVYRAKYRKLMQTIDPERWELSKGLCAQIIQSGGYKNADDGVIADTLEGLYDGYWLNILIYPGEFSRKDAKVQIRIYLATTFPKHFKHPNIN